MSLETNKHFITNSLNLSDMRVYQTNEIKNIALVGSAGSGKTTLAESMLFEAGVIKRRGTVEAKNTVSDYFPVEQEYGYSVFPTVFHVEWNNRKLNIIDCPGSDDFVGGAITALNVTDEAVILINGQYGPEVGTQNNFRYTEKLKKPVIFLINQLDSDKCDFLFSLFISFFTARVLSLEEFDLHCAKVRSHSNKELINKNRFISIFDVLNRIMIYTPSS